MNGGSIVILGFKVASQDAIVAALREAAQSPPAWAACALLALSWLILFARDQSMRGFASAVADLSELQRAEILKRAYPGFAGKGLSSETFMRSHQRNTWLFALLACRRGRRSRLRGACSPRPWSRSRQASRSTRQTRDARGQRASLRLAEPLPDLTVVPKDVLGHRLRHVESVGRAIDPIGAAAHDPPGEGRARVALDRVAKGVE